jgi:hypothetical protein
MGWKKMEGKMTKRRGENGRARIIEEGRDGKGKMGRRGEGQERRGREGRERKAGEETGEAWREERNSWVEVGEGGGGRAIGSGRGKNGEAGRVTKMEQGRPSCSAQTSSRPHPAVLSLARRSSATSVTKRSSVFESDTAQCSVSEFKDASMARCPDTDQLLPAMAGISSKRVQF